MKQVGGGGAAGTDVNTCFHSVQGPPVYLPVKWGGGGAGTDVNTCFYSVQGPLVYLPVKQVGEGGEGRY